MSCPICIIPYNKSTCAQITCLCEYSACKTCVRTYLLTTIQEPHCMNCRNKWTREFIKNSLGASFVNGELKEHQSKILIDSTIAKREERLQGAINYRDNCKDRKEIGVLRKQLATKRQELEALHDQIEDIENVVRTRNGDPVYFRNRARYREIGQQVAGNTAAVREKVKPKFIMPCQKEGCNGMLNEQYMCEVCNTTTCKRCLESEIQENHECNLDTVATANLIKRDSKPCPKCGVRISKISGCDQMWCVECKTAFCWQTGTIYTNNIHNPHYFQFMRERGDEIPRPDEIPRQERCNRNDENYIRDQALIKIQNRWRKNTDVNKIAEYIRFVNHISHITITRHENRIRIKNDNLENEYKYILGEISRETLGSRLMQCHKAIQKDQTVLDIYRAIVLMTNQICNDIMNSTEYDNKIVSTIRKCSDYFNWELIKPRMLND